MTSKRRDAAHVDIRLLGPPEILIDGRALVVDTRKAVAILALLAAEGRPFARDELTALLWPESDDGAARGALRRTLSTLRSAMGDGVLIIDRSRVDIDRRSARIDVADIERATASVDARVLAAAASRIRGPFMAGFNLRDSPEFDDWRATRAASIERSVLAVLDRLSTAAHAAGNLHAAIDAAARRADLDPLDEAGHVRLMDLLAASGDRDAALRQYRACVAILGRELGVLPLASTTARYESIRDAEAAPSTRAAAGLSASPASPFKLQPDILVGRDEAIAALLDAYAAIGDGVGRVAAVVGEAGIGKTRVGDTVADLLRDRDAVVLTAAAYAGERAIAYGPIVELLRDAMALPDAATRVRGLDPETRSELSRLLPAIDLGRRPTRIDEGPGAHARLVAAIAHGLTTLTAGPAAGAVWIDDLHWADDATLEALDYLARRMVGRRLLVVLSWRDEDLVDGARVVADRLAAPPATVVVLDRLDRAAIATLVAASDVESTTAPALIDRLAMASEGLPLYVVEALAAGPHALESMPVGVRAVLRQRLTSIGETAVQVLATAAVIGRTFDLATVRHASGRSEGETVDALDESLRRGVIRERGSGFDFSHGALRDVVYEATSLTRRRLLHRRVAEALRLDLARSGRDDLARLVKIALHERDAGRPAEAAEAFRTAGQRAASVFANREAIEHDLAAIALGHPDPVDLYVSIGALQTRLGDYAGAIAALESAAAFAGPTELARVESALGRAHLRRGDLSAADHHLAVAIAMSTDDRLAARALVDRSETKRRIGEGSAATDLAREALGRATRSGDRASQGAAHRMVGLLALDAGDAAVALDELALAHAAAVDDPDPTAWIAALTGLALATASTGQVDAAVAHAEAAAEACRRIGDRHLEAAVENHLADLLHAAGRDDEARPHQLRAMEAFAEIGGDPADPDPGIWLFSV